jgi:co-chaperonin GroES (HSP10)
MNTIKPIGNLILIKEIPFTCKEVDVGGIYVPSATRTKTKRAKVLAIGGKVDAKEIPVDSVILTDFLGCEVIIDGEKNYLLNVEEVLAVEQAE